MLLRADQEAMEIWERAGEAMTVGLEEVKDTSLNRLALFRDCSNVETHYFMASSGQQLGV